MAKTVQKRSSASPDESRPFAGKGKADLFQFGDHAVGIGSFETGWKWSEHVKPIAQTDSCQSPHFAYVISGRMRIKGDDGSDEEFGPGYIMQVAPGHDAWVVGNETCRIVDFAISPSYASAKKG